MSTGVFEPAHYKEAAAFFSLLGNTLDFKLHIQLTINCYLFLTKLLCGPFALQQTKALCAQCVSITALDMYLECGKSCLQLKICLRGF